MASALHLEGLLTVRSTVCGTRGYVFCRLNQREMSVHRDISAHEAHENFETLNFQQKTRFLAGSAEVPIDTQCLALINMSKESHHMKIQQQLQVLKATASVTDLTSQKKIKFRHLESKKIQFNH